MNYRTTQEILAWAVPLLGPDPVTGLDGEADSLLGYRSPCTASARTSLGLAHEKQSSTRSRNGSPPAGSGHRAARHRRRRPFHTPGQGGARRAQGGWDPTTSLSGQGAQEAVRAGTMHGMKGLEFQAVAVIGVEQGQVPAPAAVTPESEDRVAHGQDLQT